MEINLGSIKLPIIRKEFLRTSEIKCQHGTLKSLVCVKCRSLKPKAQPIRKEKKVILTCCLDCGIKYGTKKPKSAIGVWYDTCDICHKNNVPCASAPHDYGIYSTKEIERNDKLQDMI